MTWVAEQKMGRKQTPKVYDRYMIQKEPEVIGMRYRESWKISVAYSVTGWTIC